MNADTIRPIAMTAGPTGIDIYSVAPAYGTLVSENTIVNEAVDVVMNNPGSTELCFNNLMGGGVGVANPSGVINTGINYFGCAGGPGATGCSTVGSAAVMSSPWLSASVATAPSGGKGRQ